MKIAVTHQNGEVFGHFGHTPEFKIYDVENKQIQKSEIVPTEGSGHGALADFLADRGVRFLICGGIGRGAINALFDAGIVLYAGNTGSADEKVELLLAGRLEQNQDATCNHHDHDHGHGEGSCGSGCGHCGDHH